jgi:hypothetical protein
MDDDEFKQIQKLNDKIEALENKIVSLKKSLISYIKLVGDLQFDILDINKTYAESFVELHKQILDEE